MKRLGVALAVLSLMLAAVPPAMGDFITPPETNAAIEWQTPPPYQRNMTLDFAKDPVADPGPGIPGAKYIGYDDPKLWPTDFVLLEGAVRWDPDREAVGIFDGDSGAGSISIHFDNWERDWFVKHLYTEFTVVVEAPDGIVGWRVNAPPGYTTGNRWENRIDTGPDHTLIQYYEAIWPNPLWEVLVIDLELPPLAGAPMSVYITDLQLATECVPVPGATLLGLLGLGAAGAKLRRFV